MLVQQSPWRWLVLVLFGAVLSGCAATGQDGATPAAAKQPSGFLSNYALLKPIADGDGAKSWRRADVDWGKFDKVLIERIQVFIKEDSKNKGIDPTDLKMLTDYFYEALVKELKPTVPIVTASGPGVLGLRIAIVDLMPTQYKKSIAGTLTPYAFVAEAASGPASGRPAGSTPYLGETSIEAQIIDGGTGEVLGEFADTRIGKKYDVDMSKNAPDAAKKWVDGYMDSFTSWSYAKGAFDQWAAFLVLRFQQLRSVPSGQ